VPGWRPQAAVDRRNAARQKLTKLNKKVRMRGAKAPQAQLRACLVNLIKLRRQI
jgi:hypothetical protein